MQMIASVFFLLKNESMSQWDEYLRHLKNTNVTYRFTKFAKFVITLVKTEFLRVSCS